MSTSDEISSLEGLTGYITDSYTAGSYDLLASSSNLSVDTTQGEIELTVVLSDDKTSATITALVMPYDYSEATGSDGTIAIYFEIGDHIYYNELKPTWAAAYKYSYTAKIGSDNLTLEAVAIEAWEDETESAPGTTLVDIFYNRSDDKYYINSAKGLAAFRDLVNGNISTNTTDALFWGFDGDLFKQANLDIDGVLTTDIDLGSICGEGIGTDDANISWTPIGYWADTVDYPYAGTFDGGGHQISNLYINNTANQRGLFRYIDTDGVVCNLGVSGSVSCTAALLSNDEPASYEIGAITSLNKGFIINCYSLVDIYGTITKVGGIAGYNVGSVVNCYNHGDVEGLVNVGGIVGYNCDGGYVGYCYSIGKVSAMTSTSYTGDTRVGGVVGYNIKSEDDDEEPTIKGSFCLDNTDYSIGQVEVNESSGGIDGNVCTEKYLTSYEFATIINNGSYTFNSSKSSPIPACAWIDNSSNYVSTDGADNSSAYPTLNFGVLPVYNGIYDIIYDDGIYEIYTSEGLQTFAALVNGSALPEYIVTKGGNDNFIDIAGTPQPEIEGLLMNDIDLIDVCGENLGVSWTPIGNNSNKYQGTFDGDGHKVSNLYINTSSSHQGLFGCISGATIQNLGVDGSVTSSADYCHIGGIVGDTDSSSITACYNLCDVIASGSGGAYIGGIVGNSDASITACYNAGAISAKLDGDVYIGGIAGQSGGSITSCYSYGSVSSADGGDYYDNLGGVAGYSTSSISISISYCYYDTTTVTVDDVDETYYHPSYAVGGNGASGNSDTVYGLETEYMTGGTLLGYLKTESAYWTVDYTGEYSINNGYPILKWQTSETE